MYEPAVGDAAATRSAEEDDGARARVGAVV
jgi:hypothetical protein